MKLGLALAGGGIRGIAHAGVLKALEDNNIKVDIIGGCSSGSMIAALYAMGFSPYYIYILFKTYAKDIVGANVTPFITGMQGYLFNKKKTITGFKNGEPIEKIFDKMAKKKKINGIQDIKMPLVIPTVDIMNSKEYIFTNIIPEEVEDIDKYINNISIGKAVRASSCFPAVFSPCKDEKHAFMDGGLLDNVPVNEVIKQGADKVIAVKFDADEITERSNVMDIAMKTLDIMGSKISEENINSSDFVLNVYTDRVGLLDISKLEKCYKYGYECAMKNMDIIKKVIEE